MIGLVINSLVCVVVAASPAGALSQSRQVQSPLAQPERDVSNVEGSQWQADAARRDVITVSGPSKLVDPIKLVEPSKEPLVLELGRSRLLRFPAGIRRTALSNADVSDVVQVGPKDVLVIGRNQGVTNFTVWSAGPQAGPAVIVIRVERKSIRD